MIDKSAKKWDEIDLSQLSDPLSAIENKIAIWVTSISLGLFTLYTLSEALYYFGVLSEVSIYLCRKGC